MLKLKAFRMEAIRAGFKQAWQTGNYQLIVNVAEKIQTTILEEYSKLPMLYNMAETRLGGE